MEFNLLLQNTSKKITHTAMCFVINVYQIKQFDVIQGYPSLLSRQGVKILFFFDNIFQILRPQRRQATTLCPERLLIKSKAATWDLIYCYEILPKNHTYCNLFRNQCQPNKTVWCHRGVSLVVQKVRRRNCVIHGSPAANHWRTLSLSDLHLVKFSKN